MTDRSHENTATRRPLQAEREPLPARVTAPSLKLAGADHLTTDRHGLPLHHSHAGPPPGHHTIGRRDPVAATNHTLATPITPPSGLHPGPTHRRSTP
ncbi:hypothetical protein ACIRG5_41500 [Lentzea sp. NPDC102401]|uniref:hypothetical protein n=1 Tax=Lentzea sp. NPDC102401 TaxID=3364128 RepID=UPI0037F7A0F6